MAMVSTSHEPEFTPPLVQLNGQPGQGTPLSMDGGVVAAELDGLVPRSLVFGFGETSQEGTNGEAMGPSESTGANLGVLGHSRVETVQRYTEAAVPCRDNAGEGDPVSPRLAKEDTYERLFAEGQKTYPPLEVRQVNWGQDRRNGDRCCDEASLADLALSFTARGQVNQEAIGESLDAMRPFNRGDAERETGFILALGVQDVRPSQVDVSTSATSPLVLSSHNWCPEGDLAELDTQDAVEPYDHSLMLGRNAEGQAVEDQEHAVSVTAFSRRLVQSMLSECSGQSRTSSYVEKSVQEGKGSAELRIGVSSFPEISSDMLGTLDPPYPTYPGSAPEPISIGFSPRSLVVDPRPIKFRSNPKSLSRTRSRQADPGVYDDVEESLHCRESNSSGAGWSGQPVSGGELASAEHGRTIPIPGPEQPVCLAAEDLGVQVMQHDGCKMAESRRVTMDPTFGTPTAGKPTQPPELCHPCGEVNVFEVKGDGITMDSSSWPGEGKPEMSYSSSQNPVCDTGARSSHEGNHLNPKPLRFSPVVDPSALSSQSPAFLSPEPLGFSLSYGVVGEFPYGELEVQGPVSDGEWHVQDIDRGVGSSKDAASGSFVEPGRCVQAVGTYGDGNGAVVGLAQGPEEGRRTASVVPGNVYASQRGLGSRVVDRQECSDSGPREAASGTLPGFSELGFVGLDKSSPKGESTHPSTASQAPNLLSPLDLVDHLPKSLLGSQGLDELDRHKTYKVVSSQSVNFPDDVPMSKGNVGRASGTPTVRPTLRQDLTCTLPAWTQARLGAWSSTSQQPRPLLSDSLGFTGSNPARLQPSMPAQMSGLGFPSSAGAQAQNSGVTQGRQSRWVTCHEPVATWFSREHVCGSQCFPPLDSKKVRSCAVCADCLSSSSEAWEADSDLQESSQVVSDLIPPAPEVSVYFQTPNFLRSPAQNPSHKPLGFSPDLPQVQGLLHRNATCDPNHKPLGFSPDLPQVQGPIGGSINLGQNHEPIGFSPDLPQVQGSPCRAVNRDSSYTLLGLCQDAPMAQGSVNSYVNLGPEQYHIHSDDDNGSSASDVEAYLCWEQSWVDLHEPPQDWSSANAGPGILRMPAHEPGAQARRSDAAGVTWHVPIEMPSVSFPEYKTGKLELFPGPFFFGRLIASQVSGSNISFLPSLACTFMYRLLTLQVRQARGKARQIKQSTCNLVSSGANCWSPLPRLCMRRVLPAPSRPQSSLFLKDTLPGCTSVSGDDCGKLRHASAHVGGRPHPQKPISKFFCVLSLARART